MRSASTDFAVRAALGCLRIPLVDSYVESRLYHWRAPRPDCSCAVRDSMFCWRLSPRQSFTREPWNARTRRPRVYHRGGTPRRHRLWCRAGRPGGATASRRASARIRARRRRRPASHSRAYALVVCQAALALVLLVGAGLLMRSFERLGPSRWRAALARHDVRGNLPRRRYADPERRARFYRAFEARLAALPGVRAAAAISRLPVTGSFHSWGVRRADGPPDSRFTPAQQRVIEGSYFEAVGIPLLGGDIHDGR